MISNNRGGIAERLWSELGEGSPIHVRELEDEHAEARFVVGEVERLVDKGAARAEIAVLYRTNAMSRVIEDTLVRREIAYQVIGGTKFYERAEIKDAIAYLSWLANPFDVVAFTRVANSPRRGLGRTSLSRIVAHSATVGVSVWRTSPAADRIPGLGGAAVRSLNAIHGDDDELVEKLRWERHPGRRSARRRALAHRLPGGAGGRRWVAPEKTIEAQGRLENLDQLVEVAREFDAGASGMNRSTLDLFLQPQLALVADADSRTEDEGLVTLMTLHNAKGLEYPIVFIAGCEDGIFPHSRALDEGRAGGGATPAPRSVTRAKRELYLTYARRRSVFGQATYGLRSRFLDEIPRRADRLWSELRLSAGAVTVGAGAGAGMGAQAGRRAAEDWAASPRRARRPPARSADHGRGCRACRPRRGRRHGRGAGERDRRALRAGRV